MVHDILASDPKSVTLALVEAADYFSLLLCSYLEDENVVPDAPTKNRDGKDFGDRIFLRYVKLGRNEPRESDEALIRAAEQTYADMSNATEIERDSQFYANLAVSVDRCARVLRKTHVEFMTPVLTVVR